MIDTRLMASVIQLVNGVGFPAAIALILLYQFFAMHRSNLSQIDKMRLELRRLRQALGHNEEDLKS